MDPTVEFLWSRREGEPVPSADWAIRLLESGIESDAALRLTDRHMHWQDQQRLIKQVLREIGRDDLSDARRLRAAYEAESIADYLAGNIDGWTLIRRGCSLYWENKSEDPGRIFWIHVADDADEHGGQRICIQYPFVGGDFDEVLKAALRDSDRPMPEP